jgi:hypothetical protein
VEAASSFIAQLSQDIYYYYCLGPSGVCVHFSGGKLIVRDPNYL